MTAPVVIVDDDVNLLAGLKRHLRKAFDVTTFHDPNEALRSAELKQAGVVLADMRMPEMDGITFLEKVSNVNGTIQRMMLTGDADQATAVNALNSGGVSRFFNKPCEPATLINGITDGLRRFELENAEKDLLEKTLSGSVRVLVDILSMTQPEAFGTSTRLRKLVRQWAKPLGLKPAWIIEMAAMLLPLGWVAVPVDVQSRYQNGDSLSQHELDMIAHIPEAGANLIRQIPRLETVAKIIQDSALPFHDAGEDQSREARLLHILRDLDLIAEGKALNLGHIERLMDKDDKYDQMLLSEVGALLGAEEDRQMAGGQEYTIAMLTGGLELLEDLKTADGKLILAAGRELTDVHIARLKNFAKITSFKEPILCRPVQAMT